MAHPDPSQARPWRDLRDRRRVLFCLAAVAAPTLACAQLQPDAAVVEITQRDIVVERSGDTFTVGLNVVLPVQQSVAWAVLTDYEHMATFVPSLASSEVLERSESRVKVRQQGVARYGPFASAFESVRDIQLTPPSGIRSRTIGGNLRRVDSLTRLQPEPAGTRLLYHTEVEPGVWFPPVVGPAVVREQTARQFTAMLGEMRRREQHP